MLEDGWLRYRGDGCAFDLRPDQVEAIEIRSHRYPRSGEYQRLYVTWRESPGSEAQVFSLEARDARSFRDLHRLTAELRDQLETWRRQSVILPTMDAGAGATERLPLGLPPAAESVSGIPVTLAARTDVGTQLLAAVGIAVVVAAFIVLVTHLLQSISGAVDKRVIRYGGIALAVVLTNVIMDRLKKRKGAAKGAR